MSETVHQELLRRHETGEHMPLPEGLNQPFLEWLEDQLTEREAEFLLKLPPEGIPKTLAAIAEDAGVSEEEAEGMLRTLIEKAMVLDHEAEGVEGRGYSMAHWMALVENYLHRYVDVEDPNPRGIDVEFGRWLEEVKQSERFTAGKANYYRVIPIEKTIPDTGGAISTSEASKIVEQSSYVSVMRCLCRSSAHLTGEPCEHPLEVCFSLGDYARYQVENGFGREVSKEWAIKTIAECEERGLIHSTDNVRGEFSVICNCCPCHCIPVTGFTRTDQIGRSARSAFLSSVYSDSCDGSSLCVEECPYGAIEMADGKARVEEDRCIGCGLCVTVCPSDALALRARPPEKTDRLYESVDEFMEDLAS
jgi:ferredoxin